MLGCTTVNELPPAANFPAINVIAVNLRSRIDGFETAKLLRDRGIFFDRRFRDQFCRFFRRHRNAEGALKGGKNQGWIRRKLLVTERTSSTALEVSIQFFDSETAGAGKLFDLFPGHSTIEGSGIAPPPK